MSKFLTFVNFNFYRRRRKAEIKIQNAKIFAEKLSFMVEPKLFKKLNFGEARIVLLKTKKSSIMIV